MITVEEQAAAIEPILAAITGITSTETDYPEAIQSRALPVLLIAPGDAAYAHTRGAWDVTVTRTWEVRLLALEIDQGREYVAEQTVKPFLTRVVVKLAAYPVVRLADNRSFEITINRGRDSGPIQMSYNGTIYLGALFAFSTIVDDIIQPA